MAFHSTEAGRFFLLLPVRCGLCYSINLNKALWEKGDFTRIADTMRESGEALVNRIGINEGMKSSSISDAATAQRRFPQRNSAPTCSASISRAIWWKREQARGEAA